MYDYCLFRYLANKIRETEGFRLVIDAPECTNICFWYIPPNLRDLEETPEWWARMSKVIYLGKYNGQHWENNGEDGGKQRQ